MGTETNSSAAQEIKCHVCRKTYTPECDFQQGRCPHHEPMIEIQPRDNNRGHFYVSILKSATRIAAGVIMITTENIVAAGIFLIVAELLGILEEIV